MKATKLSFPTLHCRPFSSTSPRHRGRVNLISTVAASGGTRGRDHWGRLVDENMIVLRLRIREMKISETNYDPPLNWMEWEKQYSLRYNEDISEALGLLQNYLMNTRPGLAFGMVAVVFLSVLISSGVALIHAIEIAKRILSIWV
ncbi:uncharacterized protein LOC121245532 [Juglans microcarpa x Juglans regia]|uniref:uncharacterized protein LOC121245532 n=1 Tax=Juglans microcarpa x Juglans regia TaxID=2249226 RepID=UPI001B7E8857|nr:uncharacterized protein LOC121245532 [Juglans microcarpa x Juglans regia]